CRLRTRLRTADQQIPAELKIQHRQMRIVLLCKIRDALIGGLIDRGSATQIQGDAIKKRLIKLLMLPQQRGVRFIGGLLQSLFSAGEAVSADIIVMIEVGAHRDANDGFIGSVYHQALGIFCPLAATKLWFNQRSEADLAFHPFVRTALAFNTQALISYMQLMCLRTV